jgi:hypothetical protein
LARNGQISEEMAQNLLDERYSKETFNLNFPFLRKIEVGQYLSKQKYVMVMLDIAVKLLILIGEYILFAITGMNGIRRIF